MAATTRDGDVAGAGAGIEVEVDRGGARDRLPIPDLDLAPVPEAFAVGALPSPDRNPQEEVHRLASPSKRRLSQIY